MRIYVEDIEGIYKPIETDILWRIAGVALVAALAIAQLIRSYYGI
jgi:hypothetical protein